MRIFFLLNGPLYIDYDNNYFANTVGNDYLSRYLRICSKLVLGARLLPKTEQTGKNQLSPLVLSKTTIIDIPDLTSLKRVFINAFAIKVIVKKLVRESDAVVIRCPFFSLVNAARQAKKYQKPYLIELVGCPWDAFWNHSWKGKFIAPFVYFSTKKIVKHAPYVIYVTNEYLQQKYPCNGRSIGCSNVTLQNIQESILKARLYRISEMDKDKTIIVGTTGAVDVRYKGQEYVIRAIGDLNRQGYNFEYHMIGGGDEQRLRHIAYKYKVSDKVVFIGSLPHEKVIKYLDNLDVYIQPSKTEGTPRALIEAMSRGCPCIGSNIGGIPELLDKTYTFDSGNIKELKRILSELDKEKMIEQAKRNFEFSKKYAKDALDNKRDEFINEFAKEINNKNNK